METPESKEAQESRAGNDGEPQGVTSADTQEVLPGSLRVVKTSGVGADTPTPSPALPNESASFDVPADAAVEERPKPKLVSIRDYKGPRLHITLPTYERAWELYRDGTRSQRRLAEKIGVSVITTRTMIERGYPKREWPALRERARLYDLHKRDAEDRAAADKARQEVDERARSRVENLKVTKLVKAAVAAGLKRVLGAVERATFTKLTKDANGKVVEVVDGKALTEALRGLSASLKDCSAIEETWTGIAVDEDVSSRLPGWAALTDEQAQYVIDHEGQLPPGVDDEMLLGLRKPAG